MPVAAAAVSPSGGGTCKFSRDSRGPSSVKPPGVGLWGPYQIAARSSWIESLICALVGTPPSHTHMCSILHLGDQSS